MMAAIEHLRAVGMHDLAEEVIKRVGGDCGEREGHKHAREAHGHEHHEENLGDLRREVEELKRAMQDIRRHLERRGQ